MISNSLAQQAAAPPLPLLILDFDGTVCLGDGPVIAYAEAVAERLPAEHRAPLAQKLERFLSNDPDAEQHKDGYAAVAAYAAGLLPKEDLDAAYSQSRRMVASGTVEITTAPGLSEFLGSLAGKAQRILLTNAPLTGVTESLESLGLADTIDAVLPGANKPDGFAELLPALLGDRPAHELMSVGDVWVNDIELPGLRGCATAFIDRFNHRTGPASLRAPLFELLYPGITEWAANPAAFAQQHPVPLAEKAQL